MESDKDVNNISAANSDSGNSNNWYWDDGVPGQGAKPEWFNDGTFKTVSEQAKQQISLRKKLSSFDGAPKDGYKIELPEDEYEVFTDSPKYKALEEVARNHNIGNKLFNELVKLEAAFAAEDSEKSDKEPQTDKDVLVFDKEHFEKEIKNIGGSDKLKEISYKIKKQTGIDIIDSFLTGSISKMTDAFKKLLKGDSGNIPVQNNNTERQDYSNMPISKLIGKDFEEYKKKVKEIVKRGDSDFEDQLRKLTVEFSDILEAKGLNDPVRGELYRDFLNGNIPKKNVFEERDKKRRKAIWGE